MRITKQTIYCTLAVLFLLIAVVCGYLLLDSQHQKDEGRSAFRELASAVNEAQTTKQEAPDEPPAETENSLLAVYRALAEQNADMVGWIRIEGTTIDYPVMQTPDDFNFYLRRNFDKEYSNLGTPYLPIYHTVAESSLQKGAGHMPGTSLPIGGKSTHTVISAHSGMSGARMFTDLDKMQEGDLILLHVLGDTLAYAVDMITVTDPADIEAIEIQQDEDLVTLITCTPYGVNTHRLLVRGHRIELTEEEIAEETKAAEPEASTWMEKYLEGIFFGAVTGGAVLVAVLVLVRVLSKNDRKNQ